MNDRFGADLTRYGSDGDFTPFRRRHRAMPSGGAGGALIGTLPAYLHTAADRARLRTAITAALAKPLPDGKRARLEQALADIDKADEEGRPVRLRDMTAGQPVTVRLGMTDYPATVAVINPHRPERVGVRLDTYGEIRYVAPQQVRPA